MSVFGLEATVMDEQNTVTVVDPKILDLEPSCQGKLVAAPGLPSQALQPAALPADASHKHHDSTSTQNSESADSSPTTTVSCTDSSSLSDPSPSSSPDSPINLMPLSSFPPPSFAALSSMASLSVSDATTVERPMTSPSPRRARNMKGLSIQPPFGGNPTTTLVSEPSSPSFIKPPMPAMRRKPSQLSLKTSTNDLIKATTLEIPQSPSLPPILQRRALKHSTSSPHMLSGLKSATFGPIGGMTIPTVLERNESGLSEILRPSKLAPKAGFDSTILEEDSPIKTQIANRAAFEFEPYHENENNEDQKTPGYPDGPIAIYSDNVYLYLEPTAEEAAKFDVVINVAREVRNPFQAAGRASNPPEAVAAAPVAEAQVLDTAAPPAASFGAAPEYPAEDSTPTTPKATVPLKQPEYIHMPWDHNTDIGQDLMMLCETIERKTKEGLRVLVHCQQGASRSASLIIAYGLYQNPELSVNDAYYAAQAKSRWISPNMRLMYCLQDFQKEVAKRKLPASSGYRSGRSPTKHRAALSVDAIDIAPSEPRTAPLPGDEATPATSSPAVSPLKLRGNSSPTGREAVSPGPSSAPSSFSWSEKEDERDPQKFGRFNVDEIFRRPQPDSGFASSSSLGSQQKPPPSPGFPPRQFGNSMGGFAFAPLSLGGSARDDSAIGERHVSIMHTFSDDAALMSPRVETMTSNPLHDPFADFGGMRFVEVPPTPNEGLFSPRETMFPRDPFFPFGRPTQFTDPRSPPTKGETPIVRSIDDVL